MKNITIDKLLKLSPNINIIDIRDSYKYIIGSIPGALNIPMNFLMMNPNEYINKETTYYIYCDYGNQSKKCTNYLNNKGYNIINIEGGYNEYELYLHRK